jgi:plastocyanin
MRNGTRLLMTAVSLLLMIGGCSKEEEEARSDRSVSSSPKRAVIEDAGYKTIAVKNGGTISGKVSFKGEWKVRNIPVTKDQGVCGKSQKNPSLIVNEEGAVQNAVVRITDIRQGKAIGVVKPVLDQKGCEYKPHVLAFTVGTSIEILNSDGILHNVHTFSEKNTPFNKAQPKFLKKITRKFNEAEAILAKCDVHGWMSSWLFVTDNPYYDVTSEKGAYRLENAPPGEYTVEVWHERLGKQSKNVRVAANGVININFIFSGPVN